MAISHVGSSGTANGLAFGSSAVVTKPAGVVDGDLILVFVSVGNTAAITAPAGWVEQPLTVHTGTSIQCRLYKKTASGEPASWTWTFTSAAYVAICWAGRGVGGVYAAQQNFDGLSLLSHTTPTLAAPANAWLVDSWTGRNLLALGWSPPFGHTNRRDLVGGLAILLNVSHAVNDSGGPVAAGSHTRTAATLVSVQALNALVVLAPLLDVSVTEIKCPVTFGAVSVELGVSTVPVKSPVSFPPITIQLTTDMVPIKAPVSFANLITELNALISVIKSPLSTGSISVELGVSFVPIIIHIPTVELIIELGVTVGGMTTPTPVAPGEVTQNLILDSWPVADVMPGLLLSPVPAVLTLDNWSAPSMLPEFLVVLGQVVFLDPTMIPVFMVDDVGVFAVEQNMMLESVTTPAIMPRSLLYVVYPYGCVCYEVT